MAKNLMDNQDNNSSYFAEWLPNHNAIGVVDRDLKHLPRQ